MAKQIHKHVELSDETITFEVDIDKIELDDLEVLDGSKERLQMRQVLDVLDKVVIGGVRGKGFKQSQLPDIQRAILDRISTETNPSKNGKN